jgi:hypothetical protein
MSDHCIGCQESDGVIEKLPCGMAYCPNNTRKFSCSKCGELTASEIKGCAIALCNGQENLRSIEAQRTGAHK